MKAACKRYCCVCFVYDIFKDPNNLVGVKGEKRKWRVDGISIPVYDGERKDGNRKWVVFWKREGVENVWVYILVPPLLQYLRVIDEINKPISFNSNVFYFPSRLGLKVKLWVSKHFESLFNLPIKKVYGLNQWFTSILFFLFSNATRKSIIF